MRNLHAKHFCVRNLHAKHFCVRMHNNTAVLRTHARIATALLSKSTVCALELIKAGATVDATEEDGWTALMFAAQGGHEQCALELLKAGAAVNHSSNDGRTALMSACLSGHEQCALELLKAKSRSK